MNKKTLLQKIAAKEFVSNIKLFKNKSSQSESVFRPCLKKQEREEKVESGTGFTKLPDW